MADLIDRTRLTQEFTKAMFSDHLCCPPEEAAHTLAKLIDDAPAVDAAPVVHAHWERLTQGKLGFFGEPVISIKQMCSRCKRTNKDYTPPYCPHCGAKMDEEEL